ncbi:MAG: OsmC family protein [Proteobacteria bacterium]|nr:OsmC family protein [Pseudomonadota bacterium]
MSGPEPVWVREAGPKYQNAIEAGPHRLTADEPVADGGGGQGPQPFEYILSGLGACTNMTVRMYADRKGWKLSRVSVRLQMDKIDAADGKGKIDRIVREIELEGELDAEQRQRLIAIAEHCPVHKFLSAEKRIETRAATSRS